MGGKVSKVSQPSDAVLSGITTDSPPAPGTTTIADIPVDLLTLLFEELSIRDKIATACTCRVFHAVALNDRQLNEHKQLQRMIREREAIFKKTGFGKKLAKKKEQRARPEPTTEEPFRVMISIVDDIKQSHGQDFQSTMDSRSIVQNLRSLQEFLQTANSIETLRALGEFL